MIRKILSYWRIRNLALSLAYEKTGFINFSTSSDTQITAQDGAGGSGFSVNSISNAEVDSRSGDLLFLENRTPINRSATQIEDIKLILEF